MEKINRKNDCNLLWLISNVTRVTYTSKKTGKLVDGYSVDLYSPIIDEGTGRESTLFAYTANVWIRNREDIAFGRLAVGQGVHLKWWKGKPYIPIEEIA